MEIWCFLSSLTFLCVFFPYKFLFCLGLYKTHQYLAYKPLSYIHREQSSLLLVNSAPPSPCFYVHRREPWGIGMRVMDEMPPDENPSLSLSRPLSLGTILFISCICANYLRHFIQTTLERV